MHVGRGTSGGKQRVSFCRVELTSNMNTFKNSHSRILTHPRIRTHTHTLKYTPTLTHTHPTNLPHTSHQFLPLLCAKEDREIASLATVSQYYFQARVRDANNDEGRS